MMLRNKWKVPTNVTQHQPYDHALKSLMDDRAAEIIPQLLPEAELVIEQNVEIKRELLRADLVYLIQYKGDPHILNLELQTGSDSEMAQRLLLYHVELHLEYKLPVISVVLYLFETSVPEPPYKEASGDEELLTFHYRVLALWTLDAREILKKRVIGMYTFLPAMNGANASLLIQAINEMKQRYKRPQLVRHLTRFRIILHRTKILAEQEKQSVEEYMHMYQYDSLLDEDPEIQERIARGKVEALQETVIMAVENKFPSLVELAQERVVLIGKLDALRQLVILILNAPDEDTVRWLLNTFKA